MVKKLTNIICFVFNIMPLCFLISCSSSDFRIIQSESIIQYDNQYYGLVLNSDSKIEGKKEISIYFGLRYDHIFYDRDKNNEDFDQDVILKITRHCKVRNESEDSNKFKEIYEVTGKLSDFFNPYFLLNCNMIKDEITKDDLTSKDGYEVKNKKQEVDYGILYYNFSLCRFFPNGDIDDEYIKINGARYYFKSYAVLYYKLVSFGKISFLEESPINRNNS